MSHVPNHGHGRIFQKIAKFLEPGLCHYTISTLQLHHPFCLLSVVKVIPSYNSHESWDFISKLTGKCRYMTIWLTFLHDCIRECGNNQITRKITEGACYNPDVISADSPFSWGRYIKINQVWILCCFLRF